MITKMVDYILRKAVSVDGFSIMEVVIASGLMGVTALGMSGLYKSGFIAQKSLLARDDSRAITSDMASILSDPTACANTLSGKNPSTGASVTNIKDAGNTVRYAVNTVYANRGISLQSINIGGSGTETRSGIAKWTAGSVAGTGVALMVIGYQQTQSATNNGNAIGPKSMERYILVNVKTMSGSNIITCQAQTGSLTLAQDGSGTTGYLPLWQSSTTLTDSYFSVITGNTFLVSGNLGIGTATAPVAVAINGEIKIGKTTVTCSATTEGSLRYDSTTKSVYFCDGSAWTALGASSSGGGVDWF